MLPRRNQRKRRRTARGAGIAEFGPALLILLLAIFFPLIDLISIGVSYCLVMVLNYNQIQQASLVDFNEAQDPSGLVKKGIPDTWKSGMGHFVNMSGDPKTEVSYRAGQKEIGDNGNDERDAIVQVKTTVTCNPFLPIPFFLNIPGINGPFPLAASQEKQMENPDFAPPSI